MLESCLPERSSVDNLHNTTLIQRDLLCGVTMNVNQTFNASAVNNSINFWDENLNLMSDEDSGSQKYLTFSNYTEGESFDAGASPFSAMKDSQMSSFDTFCRSSTENDCCSLSSGEMIVRNNSFCLDDQATMAVSSLDESISATDGNERLSAESILLSITLPDISENSSEVIVEDKGNPCLNMTFTPVVNGDCPTEENDVALSSSAVALPTEIEESLLMTFTCETPASCRQNEKLAGAEAELLPRTLIAAVQDQCKTVTIDSAVQKDNKSICTSTPIQTIVDRRPNLPSFSESPFCESAGSGRVQVGRKQISVAPRMCAVAGQMPNKAKTMEIKRFPKSDYSKIKPKIVTRVMYQMTVAGSALQRKASQAEMSNKHIETQSGAKNEMTPAKVRKGATVVSTEPKTVDLGIDTGAANVGAALKEPSALNEQVQSRGSQSDHQPAPDEHASAGQCSDATCENQQAASQQAGSDTVRLSTLEKSPDGCSQIGLQAAPKKVISSKNEVRSGSALGQNKPSVNTTRPRCSSEGSSVSQPPKEKKRTLKLSTSLIFSRGKTHQNQTKAGNVTCSSQRELATQAEDAVASAGSTPRKVNRIGLVEEIGESTSGASGDDDVKSRVRGKTPSRSTKGAVHPPAPVASSKPTPARLRLGALGKIECQIPKASAILALKPKSSTGSTKVQSSLGTRSSASSRPQLNGSRRPQTPIRPSLIGPPLTPSWRPPPKKPGPPTGLTEASKQGNSTSTQVSRGAAPKPTPLKSIVLKAKLFSTPVRNTKPAALTAACTPAASNTTSSTSSPSLLKRRATARIVRPTLSVLVDKNKPRTGSRQQPPPPPASKPSQNNSPPAVVPPASVAQDERKDHIIQQLTGLLAASNCRFEALAIVLQQSLAERDEATKQCRELSQELVGLQGELVSSVNSSERLEKEKEGLRVSLEDALHRVQDQHQKDLAELEERLQAFYQAEWNKMHVAYQEEADKCSTVMQQQMGELEAKHEAMKLQIENSYVEQLQSVKRQHEISLEELRQVHHQELQSLEKNVKEAEASLSARIQQLTEENSALLQKLTAEENRRKELAQKSQKDSQTLYLEQELESLKVVLDMKTTQLHQQEKKLMEIDKLMEKNLKLDEILTKVQQENEDLKARMERHAALSRQLSTEQAMLQETLQKESKVNKRLSMENEELLWKLNNDLSSSRKASPTSSSSPSHSFSFQSPRSSGLLSSPPVSPR